MLTGSYERSAGGRTETYFLTATTVNPQYTSEPATSAASTTVIANSTGYSTGVLLSISVLISDMNWSTGLTP